jgi:hypothetical protein
MKPQPKPFKLPRGPRVKERRVIDPRPRRTRTRGDAKRAAIKEAR